MAPFAEPTRGSHAAALLLCRCGVEIWRTTYESDAREVSNLGRIRHATTKRLFRGYVNPSGYKVHQIDGQVLQSHRVVACAFIPNPDSKPTVDHVESSEKSNNELTNLRWATVKEQWANSKRSATNENGRRPIRMLDKDTREFIRRFDSASAAASSLGKPGANSGIGKVCQGKNKSALGYAWEYEPPETIEGEEWRQIPSELFDLLEPHEVSSHGRIRNMRTGRVLIGHTNNKGVVSGLSSTGGRTRIIPVARVVASVFLENPESKPLVMHVDGDKANNHVSNLAWATRAEVTQASHDRRSTSWTEEEDAALRDFVESADRDYRGCVIWKDTTLPEILQNRTLKALKNRLDLLNPKPEHLEE